MWFRDEPYSDDSDDDWRKVMTNEPFEDDLDCG